MKRQKDQQVLFGNADDATEAMRCELARGYPPPDGSNGHLQALSRLLQGEETELNRGTFGHGLTPIRG